MDLIVKNPHLVVWGAYEFQCAVGRGGFVQAMDKSEGDGKTPVGRWPMREVFYRADRVPPLVTALPVRVTQPDDAWCDIAGDPCYNQHVKLPYPTQDEHLWREDALYDIMVVLGYNDAPVMQGKGSAIFLHVVRPDYSPSTGCITLAQEDLISVLREANKDSAVLIEPFSG